MPADTTGGGTLTDRVADELRELILSGQWEDGHKLLPEGQLAKEHGVSKTTVRRALYDLAGEGLIDKGQGRVSRVSIRQPAYRLVVQQAPAEHPSTARVAEPPLAFLRRSGNRSGSGTEHRVWRENTVAVPRGYALLLDLEPRAAMLQRAMKLIIDGEPVLTSISYVPVDLAGVGRAWQDVEIGQLALTGHDAASEFMEAHERMPTPTERETLGMPKGVLINVISRPCRIPRPEWAAPAGVVVLARSDLVRLRWYRPARLSLPPR